MLERLTENFFRTVTPKEVFKNIVCRDDLKEIMERSVFTENRTKTLMLGPPATAKSLFGREICKYMKRWYYFDCTITSGKGFIEFMYEHQDANGVVLDEVDKLSKLQQTILYNFLETGSIDYQTSKTKYHFKMPNCKVVATSNSADKLAKPFQSRFTILHIPPYTYEEFEEIAVRLLDDNYKIQAEVARAISNVTWNNLNIKDVRMLDHIGSRIRQDDRADDIERLVQLMVRYGQITNGEYN